MIVIDPGNSDPATHAAASILIAGEEALTVANSPALLADHFVFRSSNNSGSQDSLLMEGNFTGAGNIPTTGAGTRMMWYPEKAAFRVGRVSSESYSTYWDNENIGIYSVAIAMGLNVRASGAYSVSMGHSAHASGSGSFAAMHHAQASGGSSVAIGVSATASSSHAVAIGESAQASNVNSMAMGFHAQATGWNSIGLGSFADAAGSYSTALGTSSRTGTNSYESIALSGGNADASYSIGATYGEAYGDVSVALATGYAHGDSSIAIGGYDWDHSGPWPSNESSGDNAATIGGVGNKAHGFSSFASGFWTKAAAGCSVALGSLNLGQGTGGDTWIETEPLFELGNGIAPRSSQEPAAANRSNAITTLKNGQTTLINKEWKSAMTADPGDSGAPLADYGAPASGGNALVVDGHAVLNGKVVIAVPQGDISMGIYGN